MVDNKGVEITIGCQVNMVICDNQAGEGRVHHIARDCDVRQTEDTELVAIVQCEGTTGYTYRKSAELTVLPDS